MGWHTHTARTAGSVYSWPDVRTSRPRSRKDHACLVVRTAALTAQVAAATLLAPVASWHSTGAARLPLSPCLTHWRRRRTKARSSASQPLSCLRCSHTGSAWPSISTWDRGGQWDKHSGQWSEREERAGRCKRLPRTAAPSFASQRLAAHGGVAARVAPDCTSDRTKPQQLHSSP